MRMAIIGCGNMGTGLAEQLSPFHQISVHDRDWEWTQELAKRVKGQAYADPLKACNHAQLIFLAIKPQNLKELVEILGNQLNSDQILISLLAGTPLNTLQHFFSKASLIRMMPNLALRYGTGVIGLVEASNISLELKQELSTVLTPLGLIYWLKESQVDALTSLTASGPAFIFTMIEAMIEAGIAMGFQAHTAQELVMQTLQGCLSLLQNTQQHPAQLKWQIASPGGTTIAGLRMLEKANVRSGILEAFLAAHQKAEHIALLQKKEFLPN